MPFCLRQDGWHWPRVDFLFITVLDNNSQIPVYKSHLDWGHWGCLTQNHLGLQEVKGHRIFRFTHICLKLQARQSRFSKGEEFISFKGIGTKWKMLRTPKQSDVSLGCCYHCLCVFAVGACGVLFWLGARSSRVLCCCRASGNVSPLLLSFSGLI